MRQRTQFKRGAKFANCGHAKTERNTTVSRQCRECCRAAKREARRLEREARTAAIAAPLPPTPSTRYALLMAEAKAAYLAHLERERGDRKGGRPKGAVSVGKALNPHRPRMELTADPADALLNALGRYEGAA
jgi:hypothetical protein